MNSMIASSLLCIMIGLTIAWMVNSLALKKMENTFHIKLCAMLNIYLQACIVEPSIDDIFMSGKGFAYIVIEIVYIIVGFIALSAIMSCINMIRFIRGTWVPEAIKEKIVKVIWFDKFTVTKLICIEDAKIRKWLKENLEQTLMEIENAYLKSKYYHSKLRKTYRSFTPEIQAIYQDLAEWERLYEKAAHNDWKEEKTSYLKEAFYKKSDLMKRKIDAMEEAVIKIMDKEKQREKYDREAFKEKVDAEIFRNIT